MTTDPQTHIALPIRQDWLDRHPEAAIDPDLPIIDAHHHLLDLPVFKYTAPELQKDLSSGHNFRATVFMESVSNYRQHGPDVLRPVGETEYVNRQPHRLEIGPGRRCAINAGIVGFADMTSGEAVEDVLIAHLEAGGGRFRGVRHATQWERHNTIAGYRRPAPGLLADPTFRAGIATLARHGLSFDAWVYFPQIPELTACVRALPEVPFILDHLGSPIHVGPYAGIHSEVFAAWASALRELATCPNITIKLGGLAMPLLGFDLAGRDAPPSSEILAGLWRPYIETAIEIFGATRCMFESNFPVDKSGCSYAVVWNAYQRLAAQCSPSEKAALFAGTAAKQYRLDDAFGG